MTDRGTAPFGAMGPPWSVDLLADLQAGVLDEQTSARLWPQVTADPEARSILEALQATTDDLAALGAAPAPPMPAEYAARLDQAIAQEAQQRFRSAVTPKLNSPANPRPHLQQPSPQTPPAQSAPVINIAEIRKRSNRRISWGAGILAVAAAAIAAIAIVIPNSGSNGPNIADPTTSQGPGTLLAIRADGSDVPVAQVVGTMDYGLMDKQKLGSCLSANGLDPAVKPVGVRPVSIEGKSAVLVILTTGNLAQFRLIAVPTTCDSNSPGMLFDRVVGR